MEVEVDGNKEQGDEGESKLNNCLSLQSNFIQSLTNEAFQNFNHHQYPEVHRHFAQHERGILPLSFFHNEYGRGQACCSLLPYLD